jgi:hypothetical protein
MLRDAGHSDAADDAPADAPADAPVDAPVDARAATSSGRPSTEPERTGVAFEPRGGTSEPNRAGVTRSQRPTTVADFEARLTSAWDAAHADAQRPTAAEFEYAAQRSRDETARDLQYAAGAAEERLKQQLGSLESWLALQSKRGVADDGPVTIELRARGRNEIAANAPPGKLAGAEFDPLDAGTRESEGEGVVGPVHRLGRSMVVERVEIDARLGRGSKEEGNIEVRWPGGSQRWEGRSDRLRAVLEGCSRPSSLSELQLDVHDAVARVRFVGRIVTPDAAPAQRPFEQNAEGSAGFLRDGAPIRIQIVADHGGGNPRTVDLCGSTNGRFDDAPGRPVWDESAVLEKLRRSSYWTENSGLIPPRSVFRVTRIDWRVRLLGGNDHSRFEISAPGGKERSIVTAAPSRDAPNGQAELLSGTWNGDMLIRTGRELQVTCYMHGMADVTVFGRLEPVKR